MPEIHGAHLKITGIVQGVGFRPFIYGLAERYQLKGWVRNTSAGVDITVEGNAGAIQAFHQAIQTEAPPLARLDSLVIEPCTPDGYQGFEILSSEPIPGAFQPISPDVSLCADCRAELFDPADRRYRYPFINCTNCGPRFTIIQDIPYDRPNTTMRTFELCSDCAAEYEDPANRRFHAQPVACPVCGPHVWLESPGEQSEQRIAYTQDAAIHAAQRQLLAGRILAIKGLGGFHLACDATNPTAVDNLRQRKLRVDKPFALMVRDAGIAAQHAQLSPQEKALLESRERPIVLLDRRPESPVVDSIAPGQNTLGIMLPYTPLHELLLSPAPGSNIAPVQVLVMTSGNLSEEPITTGNDEARQRLANLADAFLMHDRPIHIRCDDSVVRLALTGTTPSPESASTSYPLRRARGYTPYPLLLRWNSPPLLATGPELKNTFCLARDRYAFLSHHIGDMENYETYLAFEGGIDHFERLFRVEPDALACDLHPNYLATRYAQERAAREGLPLIGVQHHHAHIAACLAEYGWDTTAPVIGVALDGTGYGSDGAIWGGEWLICGYTQLERLAHLAYQPLPGGDAAIRKPARTALAGLWQADLGWDPRLPPVAALCAEERNALRTQLERGLNAPATSSMGRLFDVVAGLTGVRQQVNYEAQAAIELEALVDPQETGSYPFDITTSGTWPFQVNPGPMLAAIVTEVLAGQPTPLIAARFHNTIAELVQAVCTLARQETGIETVALSGGVWQNMTLLGKAYTRLLKAGFKVLIHHQVPANDGGISLGQAAIAAHQLLSG